MAKTQANFLNTITYVLGLSVKQREVLYDDGYDTISTIIHRNYENIREWYTNKSKLTTTIGLTCYGDQRIKCLQDLALWDTNLTLRGIHIVLVDFDATMMVDCIDEAKLDYENRKNDPDIKKPDKFLHKNWVAWEDMVYT